MPVRRRLRLHQPRRPAPGHTGDRVRGTAQDRAGVVERAARVDLRRWRLLGDQPPRGHQGRLARQRPLVDKPQGRRHAAARWDHTRPAGADQGAADQPRRAGAHPAAQAGVTPVHATGGRHARGEARRCRPRNRCHRKGKGDRRLRRRHRDEPAPAGHRRPDRRARDRPGKVVRMDQLDHEHRRPGLRDGLHRRQRRVDGLRLQHGRGAPPSRKRVVPPADETTSSPGSSRPTSTAKRSPTSNSRSS